MPKHLIAVVVASAALLACDNSTPAPTPPTSGGPGVVTRDCEPLLDASGQVVGYDVVTRDIAGNETGRTALAPDEECP